MPSLDTVSVLTPLSFPMTPDQAFADLLAKDSATAAQLADASWYQDGDSVVREALDTVYGTVRMVVSNFGYSIVRGAN